jgi:Cytochrome oxidase complex assembly protein 1
MTAQPMPTQATDPMRQPPPKKRSACVWIGVGCLVLIGAFAAVIGVIAVVVFGSMRNSIPYREALERAQSDTRVVAALGTPIKGGYFFTGSINVKNREGEANLDVPISGPKGKATLHVVATKRHGRWVYLEMTVIPEEGETINLLEGKESGTTYL